MTPREIIAEAWTITTRERLLRKWGFFSSFFETLLNIKLIGYQLYFLHAYLVGSEVGFFDDALWLFETTPTWVALSIIGTFLILLGIEFVVPSLTKGAIIGLTAKAYHKDEMKGGRILALTNFFPIFAIHELFVLSGWATAVTAISLILRYVGGGGISYYMVGFVVFVWALSNILKFMASFAEPAVVIDRVGVFESIGRSLKLVISYLEHVMFLWLLLFVISIRIMINTLLVLLIPALAMGLGILLTYVLSPVISYSIAGVIGLVLIWVASYFFAYLHVFKEAVWTLTYIELKHLKDLTIIEGKPREAAAA